MSFNSQLSIYIPRVFPNWRNAAKMTAVFDNLEIGSIRRIDFVDKETPKGEKFSQAFIHFHEWYDNHHTRNLQERIGDVNETAKIVYDDPWFWMLFKNTNPLTETELRLHERLAEMEKRHEQDQLNNQYWMRTLLAQVDQQDKNIGHMWGHCASQGMPQDGNEFQSRMDELLEEAAGQRLDEFLQDAERSHQDFVDAMENLGTRSDPVEVSDADSTDSDMPTLESDYAYRRSVRTPSPERAVTPAPAPLSYPSTPRNNLGVMPVW
tara:strand:- start:113 stop:907 length:795 start_codon:yes stop_codon:yes gene_type:complete